MRLLKRSIPAAILTVACSALSAGAFDLNAAIRNAKAGDTIRVPAGVYSGPVVIDRSLKLIADPGAVIDGHGRGNVVTIKAAGTVFKGFTVRGSGDALERDEAGIWVAAPKVTVENCVLEDVLFGVCVHQGAGSIVRGNTIGGKNLDIARRGDAIRLWYSANCVVDSNTVHDVRDVVIWFSKRVTISDNHVTRSRYGLHFMYCDDNTLVGNRLEDNSVGVYLMNSRNLVLHGNTLVQNRGSSGYGIGLKDMDGVDAQDNRIAGNRIGVYIDSSPTAEDVFNHFTRNHIAYNDVGVALLPSVRRNLFKDNAFVENQEQVAILGSGKLEGNSFTVAGRGNFWSDYRGYDHNRDGIGDLPYRSQSLFENLMDREPKLRLFLYSPSQQALELAATAFPAVKPRPKLVDDAPLMRPVELHTTVEASAFAWPPAEAGAAFLGGATTVIAIGTRKNRRQKVKVPKAAGSIVSQPVTAGEVVLSVDGLTKRFGRFTAVDNLSFELLSGQAVALWGTNGAGKTTAIRCIMGLIRSRGRVAIAGRELRRSGKALRGMIGYVPQESGFQGDLSVIEALRLYARLKGAPEGRAEQLLEEVGLSDHLDKRVANLSGGMRKRLALAAALLNDPPLLVLDEIAANLDAGARHAFLSLLCRLKGQGKTILFTSHRLDEVESLADRVLVLNAGRVEHDVSPSGLTRALGLVCEVRLTLPEGLVDPALGILHTAGLSARRAGRGVCVRIGADRKAEPIHLLARHEIVIDNFEVENQDAELSYA